MIKERTGLERLRIALTGKRTYNCCDCDLVFRIRDRRRFARNQASGSTTDSHRPGQSGVTIEDAGRAFASLIQDTTLSRSQLADKASEIVLRFSRDLLDADLAKLMDAFMMTSRILENEVSRRRMSPPG
jgi:hypothetical protein